MFFQRRSGATICTGPGDFRLDRADENCFDFAFKVVLN